jgi:Tfp pilus assembly protein PilO
MNKYLSSLNPAERRFVIIVALVFFIVINVFWIWPHFGDLSDFRSRLEKARVNYAQRENIIANEGRLKTEIAKLTSEGGSVPPEDQALQFLRTIQVQAAQSGIGFQGSTRTATATNQFFIEQSQTITVVGREDQLVDFLYNLGSGNSLIRVREMSVRPDQPRQQLNATITLVASYQKSVRAAAKPAAGTGKPAATSANPSSKAAPAPAAPAPRPAAPKSPTSPTSNNK